MCVVFMHHKTVITLIIWLIKHSKTIKRKQRLSVETSQKEVNLASIGQKAGGRDEAQQLERTWKVPDVVRPVINHSVTCICM